MALLYEKHFCWSLSCDFSSSISFTIESDPVGYSSLKNTMIHDAFCCLEPRYQKAWNPSKYKVYYSKTTNARQSKNYRKLV